MWAFPSPPPCLVVKLVLQYYAYRSFYIACEKVCGDSLLSLRFPCTLRQQSVFDTLLLGFQQFLYAHLYFAFRLVSVGSNFYVSPTSVLFRLYHMNYCATCNELFRSSLTVYEKVGNQQLLIPKTAAL